MKKKKKYFYLVFIHLFSRIFCFYIVGSSFELTKEYYIKMFWRDSTWYARGLLSVMKSEIIGQCSCLYCLFVTIMHIFMHRSVYMLNSEHLHNILSPLRLLDQPQAPFTVFFFFSKLFLQTSCLSRENKIRKLKDPWNYKRRIIFQRYM